ncbi:hypothetical protein DIPPA_17230 [Diplonema papillatum]|nr:hypothetical protein DIPPA_17230 [Diplonema papillatum]
MAGVAFQAHTIDGSGVTHSTTVCELASSASPPQRISPSETAAHGSERVLSEASAAAPAAGPAATAAATPAYEARAARGSSTPAPVKFADAETSRRMATSSSGAATAGTTCEPATSTTRATATAGSCTALEKFAALNPTTSPSAPPTPPRGRSSSHTRVVSLPGPPKLTLPASVSKSHATCPPPTAGGSHGTQSAFPARTAVAFALKKTASNGADTDDETTTSSPPWVCTEAETLYPRTMGSPGSATLGQAVGCAASTSRRPTVSRCGVCAKEWNQSASMETDPSQRASGADENSGVRKTYKCASCAGPKCTRPAIEHTAAALALRAHGSASCTRPAKPHRTSAKSSTSRVLTTTLSPPWDISVAPAASPAPPTVCTPADTTEKSPTTATGCELKTAANCSAATRISRAPTPAVREDPPPTACTVTTCAAAPRSLPAASQAYVPSATLAHGSRAEVALCVHSTLSARAPPGRVTSTVSPAAGGPVAVSENPAVRSVAGSAASWWAPDGSKPNRPKTCTYGTSATVA